MWYQIFLLLMAVFSLLLLFVVISSFWSFLKTTVPFYRTPAAEVAKIIEMAQIESGLIVYDLGSGDGSFLLQMSKDKPDNQYIGYELALWTVWLARIKAWAVGSKAQFHCKDFFKISLEKADIIYCYLYPTVMKLVEKKISNECNKGTIVISRDYPLAGLNRVDYSATFGDHELFVYRV